MGFLESRNLVFGFGIHIISFDLSSRRAPIRMMYSQLQIARTSAFLLLKPNAIM